MKSVASLLEAGLYVPGNRDEFPFLQQVVSTELFSPVIVAFPAEITGPVGVKKTYRHHINVGICDQTLILNT